MSYTLLIEKTEVKHYRLDVELDYDDLVEWVDKFALGPSSYKEYLVKHLFDLTVWSNGSMKAMDLIKNILWIIFLI